MDYQLAMQSVLIIVVSFFYEIQFVSDRHDITEILWNVALNIMTLTPESLYFNGCQYFCVITVYLQLYGADHVLFMYFEYERFTGIDKYHILSV